MTEEEKEKAIKKLLYNDKREEFKKFVESLKQKNGHGPSTSSALDSARQFIPVLQKDTSDLVSKIANAGDEAAASELRKDVVSIEEDKLTETTISEKKGSKNKSKKRRHARPLFKSEAKNDDGLVPVNVFLCQMKPLPQEDPATAPPLITMVPEPIEECSTSEQNEDILPQDS